MNFRHVGIVCNNLDDSLHFYCQLLGFSISKRLIETGGFIAKILGFPEAIVETVKLSPPMGEGQLELLHFVNPETTSHQSLNSIGLTHVAFRVHDLEKLYRNLNEKLIHFVSSPQISDDKNAKVCFCKDPNGVYLELVELLV